MLIQTFLHTFRVLLLNQLNDSIFFLSLGHERVTKVFDFLHNTLEIPHNNVLFWPEVLCHDLEEMKPRHAFLKFCGRAQYDSRLENYVPLKSLATTTDLEFCQRVAKCDIHEYFNFMKTL